MAIRRDRNGRIYPINDAGEAPTRAIQREERAKPGPETPAPDGERTRLFRRVTPPPLDEAIQDPVVGWLVIIKGPGQGKALKVGYGMNSLGRGSGARIRLDFGDLEISRDNHAMLTYDPRGRRFYMQHGEGTNLTYLNNQPILAPVELTGGETILLGQTQLRFVPLCGPDFDWQDIG